MPGVETGKSDARGAPTGSVAGAAPPLMMRKRMATVFERPGSKRPRPNLHAVRIVAPPAGSRR